MSYDPVLDSTIFASLGIFAIFIVIIPLSIYIFNALALMTIATNRGSDKGWLAWVPIANSFLIPILVDDDVDEPLRGKMVIVYGATLVLSIIPLIGVLFAIANAILAIYAIFVLFKQYTENYTMYLVILILTGGLATPFLLFRIRNRQAVVLS